MFQRIASLTVLLVVAGGTPAALANSQCDNLGPNAFRLGPCCIQPCKGYTIPSIPLCQTPPATAPIPTLDCYGCENYANTVGKAGTSDQWQWADAGSCMVSLGICQWTLPVGVDQASVTCPFSPDAF